MAWRFQKRFKLAPGLRLNISNKSVSLTGGVPGASVNIGKKGVHRTLGVPGSGISNRAKVGGKNDAAKSAEAPPDMQTRKPSRAAALAILVAGCGFLWFLVS